LSYNNTIIPIIKFDNCFQFLSKKENFQDTYCQICGQTGNSIYQEVIYTMPNYLIIILNYGKGNIFDCNVQIPEAFCPSIYVEKEKNIEFNLIGIISHSEENMKENYIAFCKHFMDGKWRCYNDSIVTECNNDYLQKGIPYILFYQKNSMNNNQNISQMNNNHYNNVQNLYNNNQQMNIINNNYQQNMNNNIFQDNNYQQNININNFQQNVDNNIFQQNMYIGYNNKNLQQNNIINNINNNQFNMNNIPQNINMNNNNFQENIYNNNNITSNQNMNINQNQYNYSQQNFNINNNTQQTNNMINIYSQQNMNMNYNNFQQNNGNYNFQ